MVIKNDDETTKLASKVLGKTSDGSTMMPYITPDKIDTDVLVGIPRHVNRGRLPVRNVQGTGADIWRGVDAWNGYEFSCLLDNGFPVSGVIKIVFSAFTYNIIESKSLKLYLNSFNMVKMGATVEEAVANVEEKVYKDIFPVLFINERNDHWLSVCLHLNEDHISRPISGTFLPLEEIVDVTSLEFKAIEDNNDRKEAIWGDCRPEPGEMKEVRWQSKSLRSNCRVTNQPDWGDVYIHLKSERTPDPEKMLQFIVSLRAENHFHEEICEMIYVYLYEMCAPSDLMVACLYTRRGGIDINPIRAMSESGAFSHPMTDAFNLCSKTMRQ